VGCGGLVETHGIPNVEYRLGDMEELPTEFAGRKLLHFHQTLHRGLYLQEALSKAAGILRTAGRFVILDLLKHDLEAATELYKDV
jgi:ubiquinone/menaquinone biosynthesis C-methylase UbiE